MNIERSLKRVMDGKPLLERLKALYCRIKNQHMMVGGLVLSTALALIWNRPEARRSAGLEGPSNLSGENRSSSGIDTFIPRGYTLVPIEVQNSDALDSIFGRRGVVDIYSVATEGGHAPTLLGQRLRMIRAPNSPMHFAVLVREDESARIARHAGPVFVVLHNDSESRKGGVPLEKISASHTRIVEDKEPE